MNIIHKYKEKGTTICGKNLMNEDFITTVMNERVTCEKCKEILKKHEQLSKNK